MIMQRDLPDILATDADCPVLDIAEPHNQFEQGGLARAPWADNGRSSCPPEWWRRGCLAAAALVAAAAIGPTHAGALLLAFGLAAIAAATVDIMLAKTISQSSAAVLRS
jgi:hypothetical protein